MSGGTAAREKPAAEHRPAWAKDTAPEAPPATAPVTPARRRPRLRAVVPAVLLAAGLALYWLPVPGLDEAALDAMGDHSFQVLLMCYAPGGVGDDEVVVRVGLRPPSRQRAFQPPDGALERETGALR